MIAAMTLCLFRLGAIAISRAERAGSEIQESREAAEEKVKLGLRNQKREVDDNINGFLGSGIISNVPDHHSEK
jgi:hypothetical protein